MEVLYVTHPSFRAHLAGTGHPERPERLTAIEAGLAASGACIREAKAEPADRKWIEAIHDPSYVDFLRDASLAGGGIIDSDTWIDTDTWEAALAAAGAGATAIADGAAFSFLGVRPPGHHALPARAMGFCFLNNVVVTSSQLRSQGERVAIVDWDVHHGNGTQSMVGNDPDTLYVSLHQSPFYPLTGDDEQTGARGTVVNLPLPAGTAGDVYRRAFEELIAPIVSQFAPDRLLISAGFDAHQDDPLAGMALTADDYGFMSRMLREAAPGAPVIAFLEGGYDLDALATSTAATVRGFLGDVSIAAPTEGSPPLAWGALARTLELLTPFWRL